MENASERTHSNKNSRSISSEESAGLSASTFGLPEVKCLENCIIVFHIKIH